MNGTKFDDMIGKVRALLAKADDPASTPQESEAFRSKADALIFKYKIDLATAPEEERRVAQFKPAWKTFDICRTGSRFSSFYLALFREIIRLIDARMAIDSVRVEKGNLHGDDFRVEYWYRADVCGFGAELEYAALLWESVRLVFGRKLEPKYDPTADPADEAYRLRIGGMERWRIAQAMFGSDEGLTTNQQKARNRKVTALIKQGAERAGEDPKMVLGRGNNIKTFRESYANGFWYTLRSRILKLGLQRGEASGGLVLKSLAKQIEEEFYHKYPHLRPVPEATGREPYLPPNHDCQRCKAAKSGYCREHGYLRPSQAKGRDRTYNWQAAEAGSAAALTVDLGPAGTGKVDGPASPTQLGS